MESRGLGILQSSVTSICGHLYTTDISKQSTNIYVQKYNTMKDGTSILVTLLCNEQLYLHHGCSLHGGSTVHLFFISTTQKKLNSVIAMN